MALSTTPVDINRGTTGVVLPKQLSQEVWQKAQEESAIMRLAQRIDLPGSGLVIPVITGDPVADFVAETAEKPVSEATLSSKNMKGYKIAVIELFSNEFRRDLPRVYEELVRRLPYSIGRKFDSTIFNGTAPGSDFDVLSGASAISIAKTAQVSTYDKLVTVVSTIGAADAELTGWVLAPQGEALLLSTTDNTGRPLFIADVADNRAIGRVLGSEVIRSRAAYSAGGTGNPNVIGFAGDWSQARYGIVNDITMSISEEATVNDGTNQINLWQRNMFAVRVEAELGFVVSNTNAFVKLTD